MGLGQREPSKPKIKEQAPPNKWWQELDGRRNGGHWRYLYAEFGNLPISALNSLGLSASINTATAKN